MTADHRKQVIRLTWRFMLCTMIGLWLIVFSFRSSSLQLLSPVLVNLLLLGCALNFGMAWVLNRIATGKLEQQLQPAALAMLAEPERAALTHRLQTLTMAYLALLESPALWGFLIAFLGSRDRRVFYLLALASLLGLVLFRLKVFPLVFERMDRIARFNSLSPTEAASDASS